MPNARHLYKPEARERRALLSPRLWASRTCQRQVYHMKKRNSNCRGAAYLNYELKSDPAVALSSFKKPSHGFSVDIEP
jgi:hypothetical protein